MYSHLNKSFIEKYISEHISGFTNNSVDIEITWDGLCKRRFIVNQFIPSTWELLKENTQVVNGNVQLLGSAPFGILGLADPDMKKLCRGSLNAALVDQSLSKRITGKGNSRIGEKTLAILFRFFNFNKKTSPVSFRFILLLITRTY